MEEQEKPSFYAIIPATVRYDSELNANEKLLYGEITTLCQAKGICWASNSYFAKLYNVTPQAISKWINHLDKRGYINIDMIYKPDSKEVDKRLILLPEVSTQDLRGYQHTIKGYQHTIKDNNNNINISKLSKDNLDNINIVEQEKIPYAEIIDYLNKRTGKNYKSTTKKTKDCIKARWNEGFTLNDFKRVIDIKSKAWGNDPRMEIYLRPETLFGTKFEGYLNEGNKNQKPITSAPKKSVDEIRKEIYGE